VAGENNATADAQFVNAVSGEFLCRIACGHIV
jgi:hypothetical protein